MSIMTQEEINERLFEIAKAESPTVVDTINELKRARDIIYAQMLQALDNNILMMENMPTVLREQLKEDFLSHVAAGGDEKIHDCLEFRRTTTFQYDKKQALEFVKANGLPYIRVKEELDAVPFKKACQEGEINYPDGETVNQPIVAIGKLGHLLILGGHNE